MASIVITGAGRGLGYRLAEQYLQRGATVFGLEKAGGPHDLSREYGDRFRALECDIVDEDLVRRAAEEVAGLVPSVDLLINNAAIYHEKPFTEANEFDADLARRTFDVNAVGPLLVTKHFLRLVLAGSGKTIVYISSEAGSISQCWRDREYAYCMSKAAVNMQSVILQNRVRDQGVKVLAIHPGWMRTEMGGPDADIDPAEAAGAIIETIERNSSPGGPAYLDNAGNPMQW
jgi:NAD(P)-dependent dehydrogenase (short-subunit alcohol dehydrogenase family)